VASWPFERIIPCHLQAPIATTPAVFRAAFDFLRAGQGQPLAHENPDYQFLALLDEQLSARGITPPKA
jgi:hypothetical protein